MFTRIHSFGLYGIDAFPITVEVDKSRGLPCTILVGLPDNSVKESRERIRSAIKNSDYDYPSGRITINLSPADIKKEGPALDLAIAIGILCSSEQIIVNNHQDYIFLGELALDGKIQPISGALNVTLNPEIKQYKGIILPKENAYEASLSETISIYPVEHITEVINFLNNPSSIAPFVADQNQIKVSSTENDFADVKGQIHVKRGLEIAAAGGHNVLLIGPPGSGKSMLAKRVPTILPNMTKMESLNVTKIYSAAGLLQDYKNVMSSRPFRSPHHTTSSAAIVGGGSIPRPGEVTLSHHGILFLDEFPEFSRHVLEALRQPLEDQHVTIARANKSIRFPSEFMLIAAMNPCPCGWLTEPKRKCQCSGVQIQKYLSKISGPLLDRIDIHIEVPAVTANTLINTQEPGESSFNIKKRTINARDIQNKRFIEEKFFCNAYMPPRQIKKYCPLNNETKKMLIDAIHHLHLSARAYDKILRVSRTIADLDQKENIEAQHLAEAIQYRCLDRNLFG